MGALPDKLMVSVEEYLQLDRSSAEVRYEYIDGHIRMLAGGTLDHATIAANVISIMRNSLRGSSCRVFTSDARVCVSETRYFYPDVSVSCDQRDRGQIDTIRYPRLVVEVLSPSTEGYDRGRKFAYYRECPTIQEYMIVDSQRQAVEVYWRAKNDLWTLHAFSSQSEVYLHSLDVHFPIAEVYEDVELPPEDDKLAPAEQPDH
ncbi:MAG: Uma2 family endonuclease [Ktedonobacteraceae bacterium]|nr:Uma2 family endonuclease [Ktedonobacteraceae bacterium]